MTQYSDFFIIDIVVLFLNDTGLTVLDLKND